MPKLALAKIGKLTLCLAAGTVIMAIKGIASSVPTAVERPSCHQTSGASDERFQRTNPNGTEYTTADTAMQNPHCERPVVLQGVTVVGRQRHRGAVLLVAGRDGIVHDLVPALVVQPLGQVVALHRVRAEGRGDRDASDRAS